MSDYPKKFEYIWIDNKYNLRSKTRVLHTELPIIRSCNVNQFFQSIMSTNIFNFISQLMFNYVIKNYFFPLKILL